MIKCKFCDRTFNEKAGKRHIPHCEKNFRPNQFKKGGKPKKRR